ncbi:MAG: hypothetical protein ABSE82_14960 [Nitrososphaerales archaeon]
MAPAPITIVALMTVVVLPDIGEISSGFEGIRLLRMPNATRRYIKL